MADKEPFPLCVPTDAAHDFEMRGAIVRSTDQFRAHPGPSALEGFVSARVALRMVDPVGTEIPGPLALGGRAPSGTDYTRAMKPSAGSPVASRIAST